jgi:16S rRNA processing protein RimM
MNNSYYYLGYISKTVGNKGDVMFTLDTDEPDAYAELPMIFIDIKGRFIPYQIEKIIIRGEKAQVHLKDIDNVQLASSLSGTSLHLPIDYLPKLKGNSFYYHEIIGFEVEDKIFGKIGLIKDVLDHSSQAIFQIMHDEKEVLIPIADDFVKKVDRKKKLIKVEVPEGLIELYLQD